MHHVSYATLIGQYPPLMLQYDCNPNTSVIKAKPRIYNRCMMGDFGDGCRFPVVSNP